ncbi:methyltransferase domain-containing protein [Sphingomonas parva]|uniref:Methyltransferase domain-containing protein n=1 Tax=Sphingomonas parva TaxID=2555898 RepID=A0A4Y8ZL53_9SPHN|nr:methyltransferase domain-containing protein [Sphingomonas parva]TFI56718.1 methyltransferase domain-containing protein [Sphingomonas parva]
MSNSCLLCGGPPGGAAFPYAMRWQDTLYVYRGCRRCGASFVAPVPSAEVLAGLFHPDVYHAAFYPVAEPTPAQRQVAREIAERVGRGRSLLGFGCANGAFLLAAAAEGLEAEGVEGSAEAAAMAQRSCGHLVRTIEQLALSGQTYDVIHIADVLGHLPDPRATLRRLEAHLAPGGLFVIEGPLERQHSPVYYAASFFGWLKYRLLRRPPPEGPPYHLSLASLASQKHLFDLLGYHCLSLSVSETGWPFVGAEGPGIGARLKRGVAGLALRLSAGPVGRRFALGNRFRAWLRPGCGSPAIARPEPGAAAERPEAWR